MAFQRWPAVLVPRQAAAYRLWTHQRHEPDGWRDGGPTKRVAGNGCPAGPPGVTNSRAKLNRKRRTWHRPDGSTGDGPAALGGPHQRATAAAGIPGHRGAAPSGNRCTAILPSSCGLIRAAGRRYDWVRSGTCPDLPFPVAAPARQALGGRALWTKEFAFGALATARNDDAEPAPAARRQQRRRRRATSVRRHARSSPDATNLPACAATPGRRWLATQSGIAMVWSRKTEKAGTRQELDARFRRYRCSKPRVGHP